MNADIKANIAIILSVLAIGISIFAGGLGTSPAPTGPEGFIKQTAKDAGLRGRTFDKCIEDPEIQAKIDSDIDETNAIAEYAELPGIGTPFNLVITDSQVIPVSGAYPYEFFDLVIKQINEKGSVSQDVLDQFKITPIDYDITTSGAFSAFNPETDHYKGNPDADIVIIEYSDYECPFCSRVHPTLDRLAKEHDNLVWVFRNLPLSIHAQALPAARAGECVAEHEGNEAFWKFTDTIFENQKKLSQ